VRAAPLRQKERQKVLPRMGMAIILATDFQVPWFIGGALSSVVEHCLHTLKRPVLVVFGLL
jgi:hypothetical protein